MKLQYARLHSAPSKQCEQLFVLFPTMTLAADTSSLKVNQSKGSIPGLKYMASAKIVVGDAVRMQQAI